MSVLPESVFLLLHLVDLDELDLGCPKFEDISEKSMAVGPNTYLELQGRVGGDDGCKEGGTVWSVNIVYWYTWQYTGEERNSRG